MPRIVYLGIFLLVAAIPFIFFSGLQAVSSSGSSGYHGGYYRRGPTFLFMNFDGGSSRGRGYSSGGFQGGGFRSGK